MPAPSFELFGPPHLATIAVVLAVSAAVPLVVRRAGSARLAGGLATALAVVVVVHELFKIWLRAAVYDFRLANVLPLHLCSVAIVLTALVLVWRSYRAYELLYFWGLGGTLVAVLTPDLQHGYPHPIYLTYFVSHGLIVLGAVYATVVFRLRPTPRSIVRVWLTTVVYGLLVIVPVNLLLDTNYLYLRHKPTGASIIDYLGPWPWYLVVLAVLAWGIFFIVYSPFFFRDLVTGRESGG